MNVHHPVEQQSDPPHTPLGHIFHGMWHTPLGLMGVTITTILGHGCFRCHNGEHVNATGCTFRKAVIFATTHLFETGVERIKAQQRWGGGAGLQACQALIARITGRTGFTIIKKDFANGC